MMNLSKGLMLFDSWKKRIPRISEYLLSYEFFIKLWARRKFSPSNASGKNEESREAICDTSDVEFPVAV